MYSSNIKSSRHFCVQLITLVCLFSFFFVPFDKAISAEVNLDIVKDDAVGQYVEYFQESDRRLSIDQAIMRFNDKQGYQSNNDSVSLGIGVAPVWLKFRVANPSEEKLYRLSVETPWLDIIDTWLVENGRVIKRVTGGDAMPLRCHSRSWPRRPSPRSVDQSRNHVHSSSSIRVSLVELQQVMMRHTRPSRSNSTRSA